MLTEPTIVTDILDEVCQSRETRSAVTLAVTLVDRGRLTTLGDPVGLVSQVLIDLGSAGMVTYSLRNGWSDIPLYIKATRLGYERAGYERITPEIGSRSAKRGYPLHPGPTDFRSLDDRTWGGDIERMSLADHLDLYPEHVSIHPHPWECGPYKGEPMQPRSVVASENGARKAQQALIDLDNEAKFTQIQEQLGVASDTATRWLEEALKRGLVERVGEPQHTGTYWRVKADDSTSTLVVTSARETILKILEEGEQEDDRSLVKAMAYVSPGWRSLGIHSLDHQLFSMEKAGLIEMKVAREGSAQKITRIRLPKVHSNGRVDDETLAALIRHDEQETPEPVVEPVEAVVLVPQDVLNLDARRHEAVGDVVLGRFPILTSLQARARERDETNRRAEAFLSAASALDGVAQDESDRLMALANEIAAENALTPVEAEYLRFAERHQREATDALLDELRGEGS